MYVMTPEFGAASQLEKIDMLDFAEFVAINKFDRKGAPTRCATWPSRSSATSEALSKQPDEMPVFGTMAARFNDDGVTALYQALKPRLAELGLKLTDGSLPRVDVRHSTNQTPSCRRRARATWPRSATPCAATRSAPASRPKLAREIQQLKESARMLKVDKPERAPAAEAALDLAGKRLSRMDTRRAAAARAVARHAAGLRRRRVRGEDPRQGNPHRR